jgi:hypothetical protein
MPCLNNEIAKHEESEHENAPVPHQPEKDRWSFLIFVIYWTSTIVQSLVDDLLRKCEESFTVGFLIFP